MNNTFYEIIIDSPLPDKMSHYFDPLNTLSNDQQTIISGNIIDQSALFGIIATIRDLNLKLVSINRK